MSYNAAVSVECKATQVKTELGSADVDPRPAETKQEKQAIEDAIAAAASLASGYGSSLVLASVNVFVGEKDDDGFAPAHATATISRVNPAALEQRKEQEAAAEEVRQREEKALAEREAAASDGGHAVHDEADAE